MLDPRCRMAHESLGYWAFLVGTDCLRGEGFVFAFFLFSRRTSYTLDMIR